MPIPTVPAPHPGLGPFGQVPGPIDMPDPAADLAAQYPGLADTNKTLSSDILAKLGGNISPGTMAALQSAAAQFGTRSGMPGSGLQWNNLFGNIVGFAENQTQQGIQDYNATVPTISRTQTVDPALQAEIAGQNALNAAAPDPTAQSSYAKTLYDQYLSALSKSRPAGGGGTSGLPNTTGSTQGPWASDRPNPPAMGPGINLPRSGGNIPPMVNPNTGTGNTFIGPLPPTGTRQPPAGQTPLDPYSDPNDPFWQWLEGDEVWGTPGSNPPATTYPGAPGPVASPFEGYNNFGGSMDFTFPASGGSDPGASMFDSLYGNVGQGLFGGQDFGNMSDEELLASLFGGSPGGSSSGFNDFTGGGFTFPDESGVTTEDPLSNYDPSLASFDPSFWDSGQF